MWRGAGEEPTKSNSRMRAPALAGLATVRGARGAPGPAFLRARGTKNEPTSMPAPRAILAEVSSDVGRALTVSNFFVHPHWKRVLLSSALAGRFGFTSAAVRKGMRGLTPLSLTPATPKRASRLGVGRCRSEPTRQHMFDASNLTVSYVPCVLTLLFQAAGAAGQEVDEADGKTAADAGNRMRHVPLRPGRHRAAGSPRVSQVP
jgi:hypothetical protein